ncbi:MAG: hypothetical protein KGM16_17800 [Bacteroidota bacterium]|nr:hypothetical protein [Bacteroidota bacterium]
MAKLEIDFVLMDESVVMHGFRALTAGVKLDGFKKNPVMLFMHNRANGYGPVEEDVMLPIGKWYDIRVENNQLVAKPDFDDDDDFAKKIQKKVEKGYLNAASIWIDPISVSEDEALAIAGQRGPTITEWGVKEASIVDIPNCENALAIRNSAGKKIVLSDDAADTEIIDYLKTLSPVNKQKMNKELLCAQLGLPTDATDKQISEKLVALKTNAEAHTQLSAENKTLKDQLVALNTAAEEKKRTDLVDGAITAKKLMAGDREKWLKLAAADFETTAEMINDMKAYESIENKLSGNGDNTNKLELEELMKKSGKELYMAGQLERLQALSPEHFKLKYKEAFGCEFKVVAPQA